MDLADLTRLAGNATVRPTPNLSRDLALKAGVPKVDLPLKETSKEKTLPILLFLKTMYLRLHNK